MATANRDEKVEISFSNAADELLDSFSDEIYDVIYTAAVAIAKTRQRDAVKGDEPIQVKTDDIRSAARIVIKALRDTALPPEVVEALAEMEAGYASKEAAAAEMN